MDDLCASCKLLRIWQEVPLFEQAWVAQREWQDEASMLFQLLPPVALGTWDK